MYLLLLILIAIGIGFIFIRRRARRAKPKDARTGPQMDDNEGPELLRTFRGQLRLFSDYIPNLPLHGIRDWYARQIERAGLSFELSADEFLAVKLAALLVMTLFAFVVYFVLFPNILVLAGLIFIGLVYPDLRLSAAVRKHKSACSRALPGFFDLLALSVEAGIGFDAAVLNLTEVIEPGPLVSRFKSYLRNVNVGKSRSQALREMARKIDLPDFTAVANSIVQSSETGASLAPVLRIASIEMLARRFEMAEKMAHELPVKILLPLFAFIFPATFLVIAVTLYHRVMESGAAELLTK